MSGSAPIPGASSEGPGLSGSPESPDAPPAGTRGARRSRTALATLTLGALGVVFGDIGTSPLYALQAVFSADAGIVPVNTAGVYGVISLIFWSVTTIVSIKYLTFIMRADNDGEGGIMALIALVQAVALKGRMAKAALVALGIFGASLFYGDGMITPAISVLSAVEGVKVAAPGLDQLVVPITLVVLSMLFLIQRFGTGAVGRLFGPVMGVWFALLAIAGIHEIAQHPAILKALSPSYGLAFLFDDFHVAFIALASIVLAVTGAEALYADMGHFGRSPIRRAWFLFVFPALTANYLGQGALILHTKGAVSNPFFLLIPHWGRIPMVLLATVATIIASQAVISGAFSVTRQAVQLGFLPRLTIRHTSAQEVGQVYAPAINWALFVGVVVLVVGFGSSAHLASAYGVAVTGTLAIDTLLFFVVVRALWHKPAWMVALGAAAFLTVDLAFLSANLGKVLHGGWFPLGVALVVFTILTTWQKGREIVTANRTAQEGLLRDYVEELRAMDPPVYRPPGTAVFLNARVDTTPLALRANVEHNHVLHDNVVIVSVQTRSIPHVAPADRLVIDDLGYRDDGIAHLTARFGFQDEPDVPATLRLAVAQGIESELDVAGASYFVSQVTIVRTSAPGMPAWRKRLFVAISRNAASAVEYFALPGDQVVMMGSQIEI
ncbi:MAG: system potassium uptake protein [Solirubrobacteraceae bacterium]|nr:system potassium uptake protein [Solirubrobacteraceae bacterium]